MDIDWRPTRGIQGKIISAQFEKRQEPPKKSLRKRKAATKVRKIYLEQCIERNAPDWRFVLIDYRNDNQRIKSKMMTHAEAAEKNRLLAGSGFAWAKCNL